MSTAWSKRCRQAPACPVAWHDMYDHGVKLATRAAARLLVKQQPDRAHRPTREEFEADRRHYAEYLIELGDDCRACIQPLRPRSMAISSRVTLDGLRPVRRAACPRSVSWNGLATSAYPPSSRSVRALATTDVTACRSLRSPL